MTKAWIEGREPSFSRQSGRIAEKNLGCRQTSKSSEIRSGEVAMAMQLGRRAFLAGAAATALPLPAIGQTAPIRIGLLTVKTGPLAEGGIQMEQGILTFLKQKNNVLAGRKVEFISADTGGSPAGAKTKAQELVERDKVDVILGPLAAFEGEDAL